VAVEIFALLDQLEEAIQNGTRVPLTGKVMLDPEELLALLDQIREALPEELRTAARIAAERDRILQAAREEAETTVREAKNYAAQLADETAVAREAQLKAEETLEQAKRVAREIRLGALEYAEQVLTKVEENLAKAIETVRLSREELRK